MDRAARDFLALVTIVLTLAGYGLCAFVAYGVLPLLDGGIQDLGPAMTVDTGLAAVLLVAAVRGVRALWREVVAERTLRIHIREAATSATPDLLRAAREAGLSGRLIVIDSVGCHSFVYGLLSPRVALSSGLLERLTPDELRAALVHERYHVQNLDPLRGALAGAASDAAFFLPALRTLRRRYEDERELAADRHAVELVGARPLAGALLKAVEGADAHHPATVPLAEHRRIDSRLTQLETGREPKSAEIALSVVATTVMGAMAFLVLIVAAPLVSGGSGDLARELRPTGLFEGMAFCLILPAGMAATLYRRTLARSRETW